MNVYDEPNYVGGTDTDRCSHKLESARGAMAATVRPFDRQRAQGRMRRNTLVAPVARATVKFAPRTGIRTADRIGRTISSRRIG